MLKGFSVDFFSVKVSFRLTDCIGFKTSDFAATLLVLDAKSGISEVKLNHTLPVSASWLQNLCYNDTDVVFSTRKT